MHLPHIHIKAQLSLLKVKIINRTSEFLVDDEVKLWYVIYKVLVSCYFWSSLIYTWVDTQHPGPKYLIYMTNWGICLISLTILAETLIVVAHYCQKKVHKQITKASWISVCLFYNNAVFITILYWSLLYEADGPPSYTNLYVHGLQVSSDVMTLKVFMSNTSGSVCAS